MARYPRIRRRHFTGPNYFSSPRRPSMTPEQREWLARWKEEAVNQLPLTAPPEAKAQLRQEVEQALVQYGPADASREILDIVTALAQQARRRIEEAQEASQRERQKGELLRLADLVLETALARCPKSLVGVPGSPKRQQVLASLRPEFRSSLMMDLTGEESWVDVARKARDWVAAWQADQEQEPKPRVSFGQVLAWASGAAAALDAVTKIPKVQEAFDKGLNALLGRITGPAPPADPSAPKEEDTS